jgi:hypothetical protein
VAWDGKGYVVRYVFNASTLEFFLDRSTGELCYAPTAIPASHSMSERDYLLLKNAFLSMLIDILEEKPEKAPVVQEKIEETRQEVSRVDVAETPITDARKRKSKRKKRPIYQISDDVTDWEKAWDKCRPRLKGKSCTEVITAITRIMNKLYPGVKHPHHLTGSHVIFKTGSGPSCGLVMHGPASADIADVQNFIETMKIHPSILDANL